MSRSSRLVLALHVLVLLAALAVPVYAIGSAVVELFTTPAGAAPLLAPVFARWPHLLGNTALVCGTAVAVALGLGVPTGLLTMRTDLPARRVLRAAALLAACVPVYVSAVLVFALVPLYVLADSALACGLLYGLVHTPLATLLLGAAFAALDRDLEEQALLDAAPGTVLRRVTLPLMRSSIAAVATLITLLVATDFTLTDLLVVRTFAEEVYTQFQLDRRRAGPLLTSVPVLLFLASGLAIVAWRWRHARPDLPPPTGGPSRTFPLGPARPWVTLILLAATLAVVGPPIAALLARLNLHAVTPHDLEALLRELLRSLWMAALGAALVVLPAVGLAHGASGSRGRWSLLGAAMILLLSLPAPVVGISLIGLLNRPGPPGWLYDSPLAVVAGYYVRFLPVGLLLLAPAVLHVPRDLVAAARMDGCTWLGVQRHVVWPAVWPAALTVWLIVVILCFGEIGASVLLQAPGAETFSIRAFTLLHFGVYHDLALLALLASLVIALLWLLLWGAARYTLRLHAPG